MISEDNGVKHIFQLMLPYHSKENVLNSIDILNKNYKSIDYATPNYIGEFCSDEVIISETDIEQWGLYGDYGVDINNAWNYTEGSKNIRVGVIDSGIAYNHEGLKNNLVNGWNYIGDTNDKYDTDDKQGHGTHVAGIIGATISNSGSGISGVCKNIQLVPLKISDTRNWTTRLIIDAITDAIIWWGTEKQIDVINFSGWNCPDNKLLYSVIDSYPGLFVCIAGNDGVDIDKNNNYPGSFDIDNLITVGAINNDGNKRQNSNYGKKNVDLFAPGGNILSTYPSKFCTGQKIKTSEGEYLSCECEWDSDNAEWKFNGRTHYEKGYHYISGTSMAAPHVTGVAALILSMNKDFTASEVKNIICKNVDVDNRLSEYCVTSGRLNAYKALQSAQYTTDSVGNTITGLNFVPDKELTVPDTLNGVAITKIGQSAFANLTSVQKVILPDTVTYIGRGAFAGCTALTEFNLPSDTMTIVSGAFDNTAWYNSKQDGWVSIGESLYAYKGNISAGTVINNIPADVSQISDELFKDCTNLSAIVLPSNIKKIGDSAFNGCTNLEQVTLNNGLEQIYPNAFYNCTSLKSIVIPDTVYYIWVNAFTGCTSLKTCKLSESLFEINSETFKDCTALTEIEIPSNVKIIGRSAFQGCKQLVDVNFSSGLTAIGANAFAKCNSLVSLTFPASMQTLGNSAFENCGSLFKIYINSKINVTNITAFSGCNNLKYILFSDSNLLNAYRADKVWKNMSSKFYLLGEEQQTEWILITDLSASDTKLLSLTSFYSIAKIYGSVSSGQVADIVNSNPNSSFIFYENNTQLLTEQMIDILKSMQSDKRIGQVYCISDNGIKILDSGKDIPVKADTYSLGVKIGTEYFNNAISNNSLNDSLLKSLNYFPVIAAEEYKDDILFLMGISGVVNYPVKIFSSAQELETLISGNPNFFQKYSWLFVDVDIYTIDDIEEMLHSYGLSFYNPLFFAHENYGRLEMNQYIIYDKVDFRNVVEGYVNWTERGGAEPDYHQFAFDAAQYWAQTNKLPNMSYWFEDYLTFWNNQRYDINVNEWFYYWSCYSAMAGYPNPFQVSFGNSYWANFHVCLVEQNIAKIR